MSRLMWFRSLAACSLVAAVLPVTMLNGQEPAKPRKAAKRAAPAAKAQVAGPVAKTTAKPGAADRARWAAFNAKVKRGEVPIASFGPPPQKNPPMATRMPDFVRTEVVPQKSTKGEMLAFQRKLSPAFAANDPIPASRINHFAWLKAHPNVRIYGWYGTVVGSEVQDDNSVIVAVEFHPKTEITGMRAFVRDFVTEKYHVSSGQLNLIDTDADFMNPAIQVIQSF